MTESEEAPRAKPKQTAWHPMFVRFVRDHGPAGLAIVAEFLLSIESQRADMLLLEEEGKRDDSQATGLLPLWPRLPGRTLVEFKSRAASFEHGDFIRLVGYAGQYLSAHRQVPSSEFALALIVAQANAALWRELETHGVAVVEFAPGYYAGKVLGLELFVVDLAIAAGEDPDVTLFVREPEEGEAGWRWAMTRGYPTVLAEAIMEQLEGYEELLEELVKKIPPEKRLAGLSREQRLAGMAPEDRVAGLSKEERERLKRALEDDES